MAALARRRIAQTLRAAGGAKPGSLTLAVRREACERVRMQPFKHILVATDFEPSSNGALAAAISLSRTLGAKLTVLHVWEIPIYPYMDFMLNSEIVSGVEVRALERLDAALSEVRTLVPEATSHLKNGIPWSGILDAIEELSPDMVVMGTHGRRALSHALLGSVAEKVVRMSRVPVLTVRGE